LRKTEPKVYIFIREDLEGWHIKPNPRLISATQIPRQNVLVNLLERDRLGSR